MKENEIIAKLTRKSCCKNYCINIATIECLQVEKYMFFYSFEILEQVAKINENE